MNLRAKLLPGFFLLLYCSSTASAQWREKATGTVSDITGICLTDSKAGYACGAFNTILKTTDGGERWEPLEPGTIPGMSFTAVDALNDDRAFVARAGLFATMDGGQSWKEWGSRGTSGGSIFAIKAIDDSSVFIVQWGKVLKTTDRGRSWTECYSFPDLAGPMVFIGGNDTGFIVSGHTGAAGSYGTVHRSTDGGKTWRDLELVSPQITAIDFRNGSDGWYADFERRLFHSADGGESWKQVADLAAAGAGYVSGIRFVSDETGFLVTRTGNIMKTMDGGQNWSLDHQVRDGSLELPLSGIVRRGNTLLAAGNDGRILKLDASLPVPAPGEAELRIFPNPVSHLLHIWLPEQSAFDAIVLYDMLGRQICSMPVEARRNFQIDVRPLSKGVYLLEATRRTAKRTYRITVQ